MKLIIKYFFSADVLLGMLSLVGYVNLPLEDVVCESSIGRCSLFDGIILESSCIQVNTVEILI